MTARTRSLKLLLDGEYRDGELDRVIMALKSLRFVQEVAFGDMDAGAIAASDYRRSQGQLLSEIAMSDGPLDSIHQREFMATTRAAYEKLKQARGV